MASNRLPHQRASPGCSSARGGRNRRPVAPATPSWSSCLAQLQRGSALAVSSRAAQAAQEQAPHGGSPPALPVEAEAAAGPCDQLPAALAGSALPVWLAGDAEAGDPNTAAGAAPGAQQAAGEAAAEPPQLMDVKQLLRIKTKNAAGIVRAARRRIWRSIQAGRTGRPPAAVEPPLPAGYMQSVSAAAGALAPHVRLRLPLM